MLDGPLDDRPGRHEAALRIPWSRDDSAYGELVVPLVVLNGAPGPTALLVGGVHGDEHEGPVLLAELARTLDPAALHGRVVLLPRANPLAARANRRTSPQDGGNLARLFPGNAAAGPTAAVAAAITRHLLPLADAVLDLHAGGASLQYLPCAWGRLPPDRGLAARTLDLLRALGAPVTAVNPRPASGGTLVAAALELGIPAAAMELGGGGSLLSATVAAGRAGCLGALSHLGILDVPPGTVARDAAGLHQVRPEHFLRSPAFGVFERGFALGDAVREGDRAGWLHDPERPLHAPAPLHWPSPGLVVCHRVPAPCSPGDVLGHLAAPCDAAALLG